MSMRHARLICALTIPLSVSLAATPLAAATLRVKQPDGTTSAMQVEPGDVEVLGRSDEITSWVCVSLRSGGKMWARPAAWMATTISSAAARTPTDPGYTAGSGNGFGGLSERPLVSKCE